MNIRLQLIRAGTALAIIGSIATAASLSQPSSEPDCPFAKTAHPQRILLLDPVQKHPIWVDASLKSEDGSAGDDARHASAETSAHVVVTS